MGEVLKREQSEAVVDTKESLIQLALNDKIDPDKLEKLMELQFRYEEKQAESAFNEALAKFQEACPPVLKKKSVTNNSGKHMYNYAELDEMVSTIRPHLAVNGLSFSFDIIRVDEKTSQLITSLKHKSGHTEKSAYFFDPMADGGSMNASQRRKSALTYAKRAGLESALGLVTANQDDDGGNAQEGASEDSVKLIAELFHKKEIDEKGFFKCAGIKNLEQLGTISQDRANELLSILKGKKDKK